MSSPSDVVIEYWTKDGDEWKLLDTRSVPVTRAPEGYAFADAKWPDDLHAINNITAFRILGDGLLGHRFPDTTPHFDNFSGA